MFKNKILIYCVIAILTFGYSSNKIERDCFYRKDNSCVGEGILIGYTASIMWPLYWSKEVFKIASTEESKP